MGKANEMTLKEFSSILNYLLDNNKKLQEEGKTPIAIGVEGPAGVGKTSVIQEIAEQRGMTFCKLNLAQLEEVGDLTGFPVKEFKATGLSADGTLIEKWYPETLLCSIPPEFKLTGQVRMGYAAPAWLPSEENPNGTILLLDDFSRANTLFMQAIMELINECKYISWSLPAKTTVVLKKISSFIW